MSATQLWIFGALCAVLGIIWLGGIFFNAPVETFDEDLSKGGSGVRGARSRGLHEG